MRTLQRLFAICLLITPCLAIALPTAAFEACCSCVVGEDNVCLTISKGTCATIATDHPENPALKNASCSTLAAQHCVGEDDDADVDENAPATGSVQVCEEVDEAATYGQDSKTPLTAPEEFKPVIPQLQIKIPGLNFAEEFIVSGGGPDEKIHIPFLAQYISAAYKYLIGVSVIAAAIMIVYGGFLYIVGGTFTSVAKGKEIIWDAIIGLFLVFALYTIIETLNPKITSLDSLNISYVESVPFSMEELEDYGESTENFGEVDGGTAGPQPICHDVEACRKRCITNDWPTSWPGMATKEQTKVIPNMDGLLGGGQRATDVVIKGLAKAAAFAHAKGYTILVISGWRPLARDIAKVCGPNYMGNPKGEALIGKGVSWPGGSNHGGGTAVDVRLLNDKTQKIVVISGMCELQKTGESATKEDSKLLDEIMTSSEGGDGVRYTNETWHYEFGSTRSCRCKYPNCPGPPRSCQAGCGN